LCNQVYRPANKEELFNLRHSSAQNAIERIFSVLKRRFRILLLAPEFDLDTQACIPSALCALHNFIRTHNPTEGPILGLNDGSAGGGGVMDEDNHIGVDEVAEGNSAGDQDEAHAMRDNIAQAMWDDY